MKTNTLPSITSLAAPACACLLGVLALAPTARAADNYPPDRLTYQGYVTDGAGAALATNAPKNYDMIFRIYDAPSAGNRLWSEQQTVTVDKGYFNILLGEGTQYSTEAHPALSTLFFGSSASDRYVLTTVKGIGPGGTDADILPRLRLLTSPYAFLSKYSMNASNANCLVNSNSTQVISATGTNVTVAGNVIASNITAITFVGGGTIPLGGIIMWSGSTTPTGWALCDGSTNNGQVTPNLSGRFVLASGSTSGVGLTTRILKEIGGQETHVLSTNEMPVHVHRFAGGATNAVLLVNMDTPGEVADSGDSGGFAWIHKSVPAVQSAGGGAAHTNMPPYYVLAYIMRVQ